MAFVFACAHGIPTPSEPSNTAAVDGSYGRPEAASSSSRLILDACSMAAPAAFWSVREMSLNRGELAGSLLLLLPPPLPMASRLRPAAVAVTLASRVRLIRSRH